MPPQPTGAALGDRVTVHPAAAIAGRIALPPDKSIAHRSAIFAALANGESEIVGYSDAADPQSTLACLRRLGVRIEQEDESLRVHGVGLGGLKAPDGPLDCGNSGTTMRLLAGVLAGQRFSSTLVGDASLSARPMERVAAPLREMGARITLTDGHAPIHIEPATLKGIEYALPVASAQVKSCVLLAGLYADGPTTVIETEPSRDHTERHLEVDVFEMGGRRHLTVDASHKPGYGLYVVPKDVSAAAFFLVAAAIVPSAILEMPGVGLNPTRAAVVDVLRLMGAHVEIKDERERGGEPLGDLRTLSQDGLHAVDLGGRIIPNLIDEIPALAVAMACAAGTSRISDAAELRVKESDRLALTARMLRGFGVEVEEHPDGLTIHGRGERWAEGQRPLSGGSTVETEGDHRIAMAAAVAALAADGSTTILDPACAAVSFPTFWEELDGMTGGMAIDG
jgi:3-phosphoshikimate 1-carboxyvinyltransferase